MEIQCIGSIGIVSTCQKPYWYKRKGYYIGEKWVKPKRILKFKTVALKEPCLYGDIQLLVGELLVLGGIYNDENGMAWLCCSKVDCIKPASTLKPLTPILGNKFSYPKKLCLVNSAHFERA